MADETVGERLVRVETKIDAIHAMIQTANEHRDERHDSLRSVVEEQGKVITRLENEQKAWKNRVIGAVIGTSTGSGGLFFALMKVFQ